MAQQDDLFRSLMVEITDNLTDSFRNLFNVALEKQQTEALTSSLLEGEFYRRISNDMRSGLRKIYREVNLAQDATTGAFLSDKATSEKLFHDASEQLTAVLKQTEDAANTIMEVVEKHMDMQEESTALLEKARKGMISPAEWKRLNDINGVLKEDLVSLMTAMSFQDLTGQRIKKAAAAIKQLESTVLELYVSSGLLMKAHEEDPSRDLDFLEEKTKAQVVDITKKVVGSELKGPGVGKEQGDIDALLAQFGL